MAMKRQEELPTPSLVIDEPTVQRNLQRMADYAQQHGLKLRPHSKTHKSIEFARRQMACGAVGLTVAKVGEARVMAEVCEDLLVGYPTVDIHRAQRLAQLALAKTVRVAIDSEMAAEVLSQAANTSGSTVGVLADIDVGFHRTGLQSPAAALRLAQYIWRLPGVRFDGLFCYPGHIGGNPEDQTSALGRVADLLAEVMDLLVRHSIPVSIVSGGSSPTALQSHLIPQLTEIRPGTYIFNDWNSASSGICSAQDCAARVICTVISDAVPGKVVLDAGSKTLASDRLSSDPVNGGFGHVVEYPEARIVRLSEEHGEVDVSNCPRRPRLGERVSVIPNHICPCVNLQDEAWLKCRDGGVTPLPVNARGMLV